MKNTLTPKKFIDLLERAVRDGKLTAEDKTKIEIECAYIQYETPSKLENKMDEYLHNLGLKRV